MAYKQNSYLKFVATAATATLVVGAVAPLASAASFTDVSDKYKEAVDFVVSKGANGLTETSFGVGQNIKRVDAAVLLVNVLGLDIEAAPASGFTDVPNRAAKHVNALKAAGITNGKSATKFDANSEITRGELAIWIQAGFKLKGEADVVFTDVNDRYKKAVSALVSNEITNGTSATSFGTSATAKRGDYAIFLQRAANVDKVEVPEVTGVSAINAKELEVKFNTAVDATDAAITTKYAVEGEDISNAVVSEDGKTVTLTTATELKVTNAKVTVSPIKTKADANVKTVEYNTLLTFADTVAPVVTSVKAKDTTAVITFAEELSAEGTISLNGVALTKDAGYTVSGKTVTITGLEAEKSYRVDVVGAKDVASNTANPIVLNFTVEKSPVDNVKPTVTTSVNGTVVTFDFSEELKLQNVDGDVGNTVAEYAKVTVGSYGTPFYLTAAQQDKNDKTKFTINVKDALAGNAFINAAVKVEGFADVANNAGEAYTFNTTLQADKTAPTLASSSSKLLVADDAKVDTDKDVVYLTFSEPVAVKGNFKVLSKNGILYTNGTTVAVNTTSGVDVNGDKKIEGAELNTVAISIDLDKNSTYSFELAGNSVKDLSTNAIIDALTVNLTTGDFQAPATQPKATLTLAALSPVVADANANNVFTVEYATEVSTSAQNVANYTLGGQALPTGTQIQFVDGTSKVKVTLPVGSIVANGSYSLEIKNVVDKDGNTLVDGKASAFVPLKESVVPTASKVTVVDSKTFTVDFSEAIADQAAATGLTVKIAGATVAPTTAVATGGKLTVTTNADFALTDSIVVEFKSANLVDVNNNKVKDGSVSK